MELSIVVLSIPIFFFLMGVELVLERIERKKLYRLNDSVTNISCGIADQVSGVFTGVVKVLLYGFFYELRVWDAPNHWALWILLFFAVDLAYYWAHRMSHEINLFWAGHVVHHQSEEYNLSVALRQSAFQGFFTMFFYIPIALLGFRPEWFLTTMGFNLLYQFWIHTELVGKLPKPIEWLMNTPSHHRVHHGRDPKYIDKNHAGVFIIWDRMFGTFQEEEEHPTYGITTPVNSWNPVYAQVQHFANIYQDMGKVHSLRHKIGILFNKPGWLPQEYGGYRAPQKVDRQTYHKYNPQLSQGMNYYLLTQYVIVLLGTAFFLFTVKEYPLYLQIGGTLLIFMGILSLGLLFEAKRWAVYLEAARLVLTGAFLVWVILQVPSLNLLIVLSLAIWAAASLLWLFRKSPELTYQT